MASECSCSVTISVGFVVSQCQTFDTMLGADATRPNCYISCGRYIDATVQLMVVWGAKLSLTKLEVTSFDFC